MSIGYAGGNNVNLNHKIIRFNEIATLERSKKDEVYKDCILLQLSASNGQILLIKEPQTVESKYGVIKVKNDCIDIWYLFYILELQLPDFLLKYQNGININPQIFEYLKLDIHTEIETQKYVVKLMDKWQEYIELEEQMLKKWQNVKAYYLDKCFC